MLSESEGQLTTDMALSRVMLPKGLMNCGRRIGEMWSILHIENKVAMHKVISS